MSDRRWSRDMWSVLMDDGTEYLDVLINQADRNEWPAVAVRRGWTGDTYTAIQNQFHMWTALRRRGDLDCTFEYFLAHIAAVERGDPQPTDPT